MTNFGDFRLTVFGQFNPTLTPFSSEKIFGWLNINNKWERQSVEAGYKLPEVEILFQRIDKSVIEIETEKLKAIL